jgi:hypothetical protein
MARPRIFDYDAASDETIVTEGVEGAVPTWIGIGLDRQIMHIVCNEGVLNATGDGIETVTRSGQQVTLDGADVVDFYQANKATIDAFLEAAMSKWAEVQGKTGAVISS